jgi:diguanylate cyclase (GGDEF)-like protein/PAS domain S-box-containing protein
VPVYRSLPGVVVQALAAETVRAGVLRVPPAWAYGLGLGIWTLLLALAFPRYNWRVNLAVGTAAVAALLASAVYTYAAHRIEVAVAPFLLVAATLFIAAALRLLEYQTWRALAYAVRFRHRDAMLRSVVDSSTDCILCTDHTGVILTANRAASNLFNTPQRGLLGRSITDLIPGLRGDSAALGAAAGAIAEYCAVDPRGRSFPVEVSFSRVALDDKALYTAIVRDVTERKTQEARLEHQATHDPLTRLPNRAAVMEYLETLLEDPSAEQRIAVLMLDLCRFKEVNDTLGHDVGDEVLCEVARRFSTTLTDPAFIGRIGGDEFTVVVPQVSRRLVVDDLSNRLVECLRNPIRVRGIAIEVGLSIGVALWPDHAGDAQELLRHSDIAMYEAKHRNSAYEYYSREQDQHTVRRLSMVSDLRSAISHEEISLRYQPQVDLESGGIVAVEALLRWQHPVHGSVSPSEFISIAESTDIIRPLTEWTITHALDQMDRWDREGLRLRVAVNLSARALQDVDFPRHLQLLLDRHSIDPSRLELEITETAMMLDPNRARQIVRELQGLGVRIAIDDYGTGFSSLGYLRDLRVDALKLDKSFVIDLETNEQNRVIVESTAHMAHALGMETVAEGVESEWVSRYLTAAGYRLGQGYWFARPMSPADCADLVAGASGTQERRIARPRDELDDRDAVSAA